jgi:hypothetical protein
MRRPAADIRDDLASYLEPGWEQDAACAGVGGDWWFPDPADDIDSALRICRDCPVRVSCLAHALVTAEEDGIWGGVIETTRNGLRAALTHGIPVHVVLEYVQPVETDWQESA